MSHIKPMAGALVLSPTASSCEKSAMWLKALQLLTGHYCTRNNGEGFRENQKEKSMENERETREDIGIIEGDMGG